MKITLIVLASLVALVVAVIGWRIAATVAGGRRAYATLLSRIDPAIRALRDGVDPPTEVLEGFARDPTTRRVLYDTLEATDRLHLFPSRWLTWEALAEADLVVWLNHPNELGSPPDAIELMARIPVPGQTASSRYYFVFRYRVEPPHWATADGWMAGVAGPFDLSATPEAAGRGTFSRFEPYDTRTPEEHVRLIHEMADGARRDAA